MARTTSRWRSSRSEIQPEIKKRPKWELIYRHPLIVRLTHWINVLCIALLLMSGMQIFNAHPMLHWGIKGADTDPSVLSIYAEERVDGPPIGWVQIGTMKFETTGVLGVFRDRDGFLSGRAFPYWITIPSYQSLAEGRRWHFFFAWLFAFNGLGYLIYGFFSRRFKHVLAPTGSELKNVGHSIVDHLKFKRPRGEEAKRYNVLQKLAYIAVIFVILPLMILSGLTMSPGIGSAAPWLVDLFGGRQSGRTIHFIAASLVVLFVVVHIVEVFLAGFFNEMRSMITGWFAVRPEITEPNRSEP